MIRDGKKSREAIKATVDRGMKELTGADDAVEAWRSFFEPGDVVGIKMNPVGNPGANTNSELMLEVIEGLKAAGVKTKDMIVYERTRRVHRRAGMHKDVPDGIAWTGLGIAYNGQQLDIKGDDLKTGNLDHVTGYDPDEFVAMELVADGEDPKDDRTRRSHLGLLITRRVNKLVMLPVLKDHGSAGVTGALKNMSHGSVNNVARSHGTPATNVCNQFIPEVVSHPILRQKCVLQIMDGIKGVFQGGPGGGKPEWIWEYNALFFAHRPGGDGPRRVADHRRQAEGEEPPAGRRRRQDGPRPAGDRGVRHPPAAAHRAGGQPRPGPLRLQVAQGAAAVDRPSGDRRRLTLPRAGGPGSLAEADPGRWPSQSPRAAPDAAGRPGARGRLAAPDASASPKRSGSSRRR